MTVRTQTHAPAHVLAGLYVPLITPFDAVGAVDLRTLDRIAHEVLDGGAAGLVALGTTGEPSSLTADERARVLEVIAAVCRERSAQLVGDGGDARLTLVPPFVRPGEDGVVAYFEAAAAVSPVPLIVYHVPLRTGQELSAATLRRLAAVPGVPGVKYATGALDATAVDLLADPPAGFAILGGDDVVLPAMLALGAHGAITASAHVATRDFADLVAGGGRPLGLRLARLAAALFAEPNPTVIKAVLHAQGRIATPAVRLPLLPAAAASVEAALRLLAR